MSQRIAQQSSATLRGWILRACVALGAVVSGDSAGRPPAENSAGGATSIAHPDLEQWPMWGRTPSRNMIGSGAAIPLQWDLKTGANIKWTATLGSKSHGEPVVADGVIYVGTNNEGHRDLREHDAGVLMAFDADTGRFLWQRLSAKLPTGRVNDWPSVGVCSPAFVQDGRLWYCTNRCEVVCLDVRAGRQQISEPPVLWSVDMRAQLGVFPHNMTRTAIAAYKDFIYAITANGVDDTHRRVVAPDAPSIVCFDKNNGHVVWSDHSPGKHILHSQWSSVAIARCNGRTLVIAPLGDGWVYAFEAETGRIIWKFDANRKSAVYPQSRNEILATPVIVNDRMYLANGQDPEHGEGDGHLYCVDIRGEGDVSDELDADPEAAKERNELLDNADKLPRRKGKPNPNSRVVWQYTSFDLNRDGKLDRSEHMNRTGSTAVVTPEGLCVVPDFSGYLHCFDANTGQVYWNYDLEASVWGSPMYANGRIYISDEDGDTRIFKASKIAPKPADVIVHPMEIANYSSPILVNGILYLMARDHLFAIKTGAISPPFKE